MSRGRPRAGWLRVAASAAAAMAAVGAVGATSACATEEIVLATLPPGDGGLPPPPDARRCATDAECPSEAFCARPTCAAPAGVCELRPLACPSSPEPACGCDRVTYWNDCQRRSAGVTASVANECPLDVGAPCGGPSAQACPEGAVCARAALRNPPGGRPPSCEPNGAGRCWVVPTTCPVAPRSERWQACEGGSSACVSLCEAIASGRPHRQTTMCP